MKPEHRPRRVLEAPGDAEIVVERSRFVGLARPVATPAEVDALLDQVRGGHSGARHVCSAFRVRDGVHVAERANDDGEPIRTAGFPLLQLLQGEELEDVALVVVRYYGGVKLGRGGLARAYRDAGRQALDAAVTRVDHPEVALVVGIPYRAHGAVQYWVDSLETVRVAEVDFGAEVTLRLAVRAAAEAAVRSQLARLLDRDPEAL